MLSSLNYTNWVYQLQIQHWKFSCEGNNASHSDILYCELQSYCWYVLIASNTLYCELRSVCNYVLNDSYSWYCEFHCYCKYVQYWTILITKAIKFVVFANILMCAVSKVLHSCRCTHGLGAPTWDPVLPTTYHLSWSDLTKLLHSTVQWVSTGNIRGYFAKECIKNSTKSNYNKPTKN